MFCHISYLEPLPTNSRRLRHLCDAIALRALRTQPDVQPALRYAAGRARKVAWLTQWKMRHHAASRAARANGFVFSDASMPALSQALQRAFELYRQPKQWMKLVKQGMRMVSAGGTVPRHICRCTERIDEQEVALVAEQDTTEACVLPNMRALPTDAASISNDMSRYLGYHLGRFLG